ncbi:MAG: hypothetical protein ACFFAJ_08775 [Candidatus Hodarchaeota archaeon]
MNKMRARSAFLIMILLNASMINIFFNTVPVSDAQQPIMPEISSGSTSKDVLIINDLAKYAYFGWYKATPFSITVWELLNRTVLWASSYTQPNETKIVFFREPTDTDAEEVYSWLINAGYKSENILLHPSSDAESLPSDYYYDHDLVMYWNATYGYNSTNIVNSKIPFITVSVMQTDEMGIGSGILTMSDTNDTFHIVNNDYYPTNSFSLGPLLFDDSYPFKATEASTDGRVLVKAEVESITSQIEMSMIQNITILPNGSANMNFTITIPESPLADILREAFFINASSLEKNVEYDVPDHKAISEKINLEKTVRDVSLQGDVSNDDGQVDGDDLEFIASKLGYTLGDEEWNPNLDLNWDGKIDMKDIAIAAHNYGKTVKNTGSLFVAGYYNGILVNCTSVYYRGPEGSPKVNISESGYIWYNILPGSYTVFGTYNGIESSTSVVVEPENVTYAQIDFGGLPPPSIQKIAPVKEVFHQGITMEQLLLLGFDVSVTQSKIMPWDTNNGTKISLVANSVQLGNYTTLPNWRIDIGPMEENAALLAADFVFTKIEYMMLMLQSLPGDQIYKFNWQIGVELPSGSILQDVSKLNGLNWTIDFGGGSFMETNVTVDSGRIVMNETMVVTEQNITANETYLSSAFAEYKVFSINYTYSPPPPLLSGGNQINLRVAKPEGDWSKTWTYTIAPRIPQKTWSLGPLAVTLKATPTLSTQWYLGWERTWAFGKLKWFETWMKITPSVTVEASVSATARYTKTWSYTFATWSTRFSFWAGSVLVWANLKLQVIGSVTVDAYGKISISTSAKVSAWYKAGVKWTKDGGWSTIWQHGSGASRSGPSISGSAGLSVTPAAACRLSFLLYDVGGPFVEAKPYAPMSINYYTNRANTWSISLKFKIITGVTLAGWLNKILKLNSYSKTVADWTLMSWSGTWP